MGGAHRTKIKLARRIVAGTRALQSVLQSAERTVETWMGVALRAALNDEEKQALGIALYDDTFNPDNDRDGLYPWEESWFSRRLPPPPARVLIGAAGAGREAVVLERRGYTVVALEPSTRAAAHCAAALGRGSSVVHASYQDLIAALSGESDPPFPLTGDDRFDAVLLGWGSFGHLLREEDRGRLLAACSTVCPTGPILLSVFRPNRAMRGRSTTGAVPVFLPWGGFLAEPTPEEISGHCTTLGRELVAALDAESPYFTLLSSQTVTTTDEPADRDPAVVER